MNKQSLLQNSFSVLPEKRSPGFAWGYSRFQVKVSLKVHLPERQKFF